MKFMNWIKSVWAKWDTLSEWKDNLTRNRTVVVFGGAIAGILAMLYTDTSPGKGVTLSVLMGAVVTLIGVACAHIVRKGLFDYPDAGMGKLFSQASKSSTGSGLALVAISIVLAAALMLFSGFARADTPQLKPPIASVEEQVVSGVPFDIAVRMALPTQPLAQQGTPAARPTLTPPRAAQALLGTVLAQGGAVWPGHPYLPYVGGLIEHESCISLTHSRCWNSAARLKTEKEEGAGLGQFHQGMEHKDRSITV